MARACATLAAAARCPAPLRPRVVDLSEPQGRLPRSKDENRPHPAVVPGNAPQAPRRPDGWPGSPETPSIQATSSALIAIRTILILVSILKVNKT
jgi:hypothetical protein